MMITTRVETITITAITPPDKPSDSAVHVLVLGSYDSSPPQRHWNDPMVLTHSLGHRLTLSHSLMSSQVNWSELIMYPVKQEQKCEPSMLLHVC